MNTCEVCGSQAFRTENVSEVFLIEGRRVLVDGIPARVCVRCAEITFDRETTEIVRRMVHPPSPPFNPRLIVALSHGWQSVPAFVAIL